MLRIQTDLRAYAISAGEPWLMEVQLLDQNSQALDIPDDALVLTFYDAGTRAIVDQTIGERRQDSTGEYFRWARAGTFTEGLYGKALKVELARRYKDSRLVISTGDLTISSTAASVPSLSTAPIGDIITRVSIKASAQLGGTAAVTIGVRPFEEAPEFAELPAIAHDGTPIAGETGTLTWGTISGGSSLLREVLLNGTALDGPIGGTITFQVGTYQLRETAEGPGGQSIGRSEAVVVQPAPPKPTITFGALDLVKLEGDSGTAIFAAAINLARDGVTGALGYTWEVVPSGSNPADAADFGGTLPSGNGTFAPGETTKAITFLVSGDTAVEPDEAFELVVTLTGYNTVRANGTITNDDYPVTTITATDTQVGRSFAGGYDDSLASRRHFMNDFPSATYAQSLFVALVTGTDVGLAAYQDASAQPDGAIESAVSKGAFTPRNASGGFYPLLVGQPQAERLVVARGGAAFFSSLNTRKSGAAGLRVTGRNPQIRLYSDWLMGGNGNARVRCAQVGAANPLGGNWRPPVIPTGDGDATENLLGMLIRGDFTDLVVATKHRWLGVSVAGGDPQFIDCGTSGITAVRVPVTAGMKDYVLTCGTGNNNSILSVGYVLGPGGLADVSARGAWDRWGDSITQGVEASAANFTDLTWLCGWLGYAPGQHGIGGQTIEQIKARITNDLPKRTINAASIAEYAGGRNNLSAPTDSFSAARLQDIRDSLRMLVDKGYRRVIARGQTPIRFTNADDQVRNIVAQMGGVVRFVETDGLTLQRPAETHPNDEDYRRMAVGLRARYEAALA